MKPHRNIFLLAIGIAALLLSCSKGGDPNSSNTGGGNDDHTYSPADTTAPVLDIYTPVANQVFTSGNIISITGRITDDYGLYRGTIKVVNDATGEVLKMQPYEIHGILSYNFNVSYTTSVTISSDYTVTVSFEDHGLNSVTRSVKVKVNP